MSDLAQNQTSGGQKVAVVAAGAGTADVVVSALPGRINKVLVTASASSAALELYDHATASSGAKLLWKSATDATAGDVITLDIPVSNGIRANERDCGGGSDRADRPLGNADAPRTSGCGERGIRRCSCMINLQSKWWFGRWKRKKRCRSG